jgi:hypothetical protein
MRITAWDLISVLPAVFMTALVIAISIARGFHVLTFLWLLLGQGGYVCIVIAGGISKRKGNGVSVLTWTYIGISFLLCFILLQLAIWMFGLR